MLLELSGTTMKKTLILFIASMLCLPLFSAEINIEAEGRPTSVVLFWDSVDGAVYYDIYNGSSAVARLGADELSFELRRLYSDTDYRICVAARTANNEDIASKWVDVRTSSWDGVYEWINDTDRDNHGKLKSFKLRIATKIDPAYGQYNEVYMVNDDGTEFRIFPLFPFGSQISGTWMDYDDTSPAGIAYRENAERFNKSSITPSRWRVDSINIDFDTVTVTIQTTAFGITVTTETSYSLYMENGNAMMDFQTTGSGIADAVLFKNPNPDEGDAFILRRIH